MHFRHSSLGRKYTTNHSYRESLKTIGKSNLSVGWAKNDKAVLAWRSHGIHWNTLKTIGKTSRYTRSHWMITFPAFCCAMANHSYRKPLETIGKSNVFAWWAKNDNALETIGESNVAVWWAKNDK